MLNSRPLVPLSSDLDDLNLLTPSHFLIDRSITSIVESNLTNLNENRLDNWQKITKIIQLIWKRWSVDYLNSLQQRNKWHFEKKNAKIGDMVIIKKDNLPSCQWSLGRINNIYPGKDSKVRVVEVKTTRVMSFLGKGKKADLIKLAIELGECESNGEELKIIELRTKILTNDAYKEDPEFVKCLFEGIVSNRIDEENKQKEETLREFVLQKIRLQNETQRVVGPQTLPQTKI
ncbi:integrase catalytic domain-containing protein [Trichonephila clavipes]|nr:integrase catalytic domain-containing protein [Trichonephila clavipes]